MHLLRLALAGMAATLIAVPLAPPIALAQEAAREPHVHNAYARVLGGVGAAGAVYFILHNGSEQAVTMTGITSDAARMVALHASVESADGLMTMVHLEDGLTLAPDQSQVFAPGGNHIMLMGMTRALKDGQSFALTLVFEQAPPLTLDVVIDNLRALDAQGDPHGDVTSP